MGKKQEAQVLTILWRTPALEEQIIPDEFSRWDVVDLVQLHLMTTAMHSIPLVGLSRLILLTQLHVLLNVQH